MVVDALVAATNHDIVSVDTIMHEYYPQLLFFSIDLWINEQRTAEEGICDEQVHNTISTLQILETSRMTTPA